MTRSDSGRIEIIVGTFFVAGIMLIAGMIITFKSGFLFAETYKVIALFDHIAELQEGAPVKLGGVEIGQVVAIRLTAEKVEVEIDINKTVKLPQGSKAKIAGAGLVGDTFVEMVRGKLPGQIKQSMDPQTCAHIPGEGSVDMEAVMRQLTNVGDKIGGLIDNMDAIVGDKNLQHDIRASVANINDATLKANRLIASLNRTSGQFEVAAKNVVETTAQVKNMTTTAKGALDKLVGDGKNIAAINETIANIRVVSRSVSGQMKTVEKVVTNVETMSKNLVGVSTNIKQLTADLDKGVLRSIFDEKAGDQLEETLKAFKEVADIVARFGLSDVLADLRIADRILNKWEKEKRTRRMTAAEMMAEWRMFVRDQRKKFGHLYDEKYPDGPPWLKSKLRNGPKPKSKE